MCLKKAVSQPYLWRFHILKVVNTFRPKKYLLQSLWNGGSTKRSIGIGFWCHTAWLYELLNKTRKYNPKFFPFAFLLGLFPRGDTHMRRVLLSKKIFPFFSQRNSTIIFTQMAFFLGMVFFHNIIFVCLRMYSFAN